MLTPHVKGLLSVQEVSQCLRQLIKDSFPFVAVYGEISNLKTSNGITYFTLKDAASQIPVVVFRDTTLKIQHLNLHEGSSIIVEGRLDLYVASGRYQIIARAIHPLGIGKLQQAFEQLKQKLKTEGLFDADKKQIFPKLPKHIGLITAANSAAFHDFIKILQRKNWKGRITLASVLVQGTRAPLDIAKAFRTLEGNPSIEAIVMIRGGGSFEDLNCFNDEKLVRTLAKRKKPLLSGIGHEIDYTLCDFVADLRAETPTAAAEWIAHHYAQSSQQVLQLQLHLQAYLRSNLQNKQQGLQELQTRLKLVHPAKTYADDTRQLFQTRQIFYQKFQTLLQSKQQQLQLAHTRLQSPTLLLPLKQAQQATNRLAKQLKASFLNQAQQPKKNLEQLKQRLLSFSLEKQLQRGFIVPINTSGKNLKAIPTLQIGQTYPIWHHSGKFTMQITNKLP